MIPGLPRFMRVRVEPDWVDMQHLASGGWLTLTRHVADGGVRLQTWATYYEGQGRGSLAVLDCPPADADEEPIGWLARLTYAAETLAALGLLLCPMEPEDGARMIFADLVPAYNAPGDPTKFRFTLPGRSGIWRLATPMQPVPTHPM